MIDWLNLLKVEKESADTKSESSWCELSWKHLVEKPEWDTKQEMAKGRRYWGRTGNLRIQLEELENVVGENFWISPKPAATMTQSTQLANIEWEDV